MPLKLRMHEPIPRPPIRRALAASICGFAGATQATAPVTQSLQAELHTLKSIRIGAAVSGHWHEMISGFAMRTIASRACIGTEGSMKTPSDFEV
jgi:hypothetical protein